jgi:F-type H+-transporting ATPase subunit b
MQFDWWTIVLQTINFAILVWLLRRFLYKPVLNMIDARKAEVRRQFDAAMETEEKAKAQLEAAEAERAGIATERGAALKAAAAQARELGDKRREQAERDAQTLLDSARKTLASEREQALDEARLLALDLGAKFAEKLLSDIPIECRAEAWIEHIENHLNALPHTERDPLVRQLADGTPLTIVTACELPSEIADQWKERLSRSLGLSGGLTFEINPDLIEGAELHFPTTILRFSWQSALMAARTEVGAHGHPR